MLPITKRSHPSDEFSSIVTKLNDAALNPSSPLQNAAVSALRIDDINLKGNREAFRCLASDVCELLYAALCGLSLSSSDSIRTSDFKHLLSLTEIIFEIHSFVAKEATRGKVGRIFKNKPDHDTIKEYRERLKQSRNSLDIIASKPKEREPRMGTNDFNPWRANPMGTTSSAASADTLNSQPQSVNTSNDTNPFRCGRAPSRNPFLPSSPSSFDTAFGLDVQPELYPVQRTPSREFSHSVVNSNFGNSTTAITSNSNNNSSIHISLSGSSYLGGVGRGQWLVVPPIAINMSRI